MSGKYYVAVRKPGNCWRVVYPAPSEAKAREHFDLIEVAGDIEAKAIMKMGESKTTPLLIEAAGNYSSSDTTPPQSWRRDTDCA